MKKILIFLMICICSVVMVACGGKGNTSEKESQSESISDSATYYTVTFIQENQEDVVKSVKEGESLTDIPNPVEVPGYDVNWDKTDFTNITTNIRDINIIFLTEIDALSSIFINYLIPP